MRKLLIILFLLIPSFLFATRYYIDPAGTDGGGHTGSIVDPWKTLDYAATQVTSPDTIYVNPGNYTEPNRIELAVGVSIYGAGYTSHIISTYIGAPETNASILLSSGADNTEGNQSISYIRLDGSSLTASAAIFIYRRGNVKVHHCTIYDFIGGGINVEGSSLTNVIPEENGGECAFGNEIYNDSIINCSDRNYGTLIRLREQDSILIHDNVFIQTSRAEEHNGNIVDAVQSYSREIKYYNNKSYKPIDEGAGFNFHIEIWNVLGGCEIYDNEFYNGDVAVDFGGHFMNKETYDYSIWIHHNYMGQDNLYPFGTGNKVAIDIEGNNEYVIVNNNHIKNYPMGIIIVAPSYVIEPNIIEHCQIYYNLIENCGYSNAIGAVGIYIKRDNNGHNVDVENIFIYNNVITGDATTGQFGILMDIASTGVFSYIYIRNNIIYNFHNNSYSWAIAEDGAGSLDYLYIQNNLFYENGNSNDIDYGIVPVHLYESDNIIDNPDFNNVVAPLDTFDLQITSPCIDAGLGVGLTYDYDGKLIDENPDIGAYEYDGEDPTPPPDMPSVTTTTPVVRYTRLVAVGGSGIDDGGGTITAKGVCYATSANPTTSDLVVSGGTGTDDFGVLCPVEANTTYHFRAYVINELGVPGYGADEVKKTPVHSKVKTGGNFGKIDIKYSILH